MIRVFDFLFREPTRRGAVGAIVAFGGLFSLLTAAMLAAEPRPPEAATIDATTLHHKVLCGYQGWFRCPEDGTRDGWRHWSRNGRALTPGSVSFEMWPDMSELGADEKYSVPGFNYPDGAPAALFSSAHARTVLRHFEWMQQYGIDGAVLQRFLVEANRPSSDRVLANVRAAATATGRTFALCYDLSGQRSATLFATLLADWKHVVDDLKLTADPRYLHHDGKPVLMIWGFYSDRFGPELAHQVIDYFKNDEKYRVALIGGCQWPWRAEKNDGWAKAFRKFDVISPWNVGNVTVAEGRKQANTSTWTADQAEAKRAGMKYLPVVYPGFGWTNLKGRGSARADIPRLGGEFYWRQFSTAKELGVEMLYVAMFDEVDEGTAIFKVTSQPPTEAHFVGYDGLPSDWYLKLTGEGSKLIRGERANQSALPISAEKY